MLSVAQIIDLRMASGYLIPLRGSLLGLALAGAAGTALLAAHCMGNEVMNKMQLRTAAIGTRR